MMKRLQKRWLMVCCVLAVINMPLFVTAQHPSLLLNRQDGALIKSGLTKYPLLQQSFDAAKKVADKAIARPIDVPVPKDPAGGYTHDRHKNNYTEMYNAGLVYAITGDEKYAAFIKKMLLEYAVLIPTLPNHPQAKGSSPGRLFHQALNDANWLVYSSQAYDCIYDYLNSEERKKIENGAFRTLCKFITVDLNSWFNLVHNHGVWACAAVGMTGIVIGDDEMVQQSLYGTAKDGKSGFLAQLSHLFSPDGYYTEGPYYARYALQPFYMFAQALNNNRPQLKIFEYRNRILQKALQAALQQTNTDGMFFPVNDAIRDKSYVTSEMMLASNIAYGVYGADESLLAIAGRQPGVVLNQYGVKIAAAVAERKDLLPQFHYTSVEYTDGADGKEGGISLLRTGKDESLTSLLFKYASHGLSHGHYDRLNILLYDEGNEILSDYGAARFLNIEQKDGGRYLTENKTFAMQTVAHNTVVADETSHFNGKEEDAEKYHPEKLFSQLGGQVQVVSAIEKKAYKDVVLHRTLYMVSDKKNKPVIIDVYRANGTGEHQYDLPFYYKGQLIATSFKYAANTTTQAALGTKNGYQHLWVEAKGKSDGTTGTLTFLDGNSFYSVSSLADNQSEFYLARIGANDPNFNLRREPCMIVRKKGASQLFVNVIEKHGQFNAMAETSSGSSAGTRNMRVIQNDDNYTVVAIQFANEKEWLLVQCNKDYAAQAKHSLTIEGKTVNWTGPYNLARGE
ncbi:MAG: heparinase II/III family protein [Chitinophagaceae bacterium]